MGVHHVRAAYWIPRDQLPPKLQQELAEYLGRLGDPDPFLGQEARVLRAGTVSQYGYALVVIASALVRSGVPLEQLTSIATLVCPRHVETALKFMYNRAGGRVSSYLQLVAHRPQDRRPRRVARGGAGPAP